LACSKISGGTTGSVLGCGLRLIFVSVTQLDAPRLRRVTNNRYAASGSMYTTLAASKVAAHRGHFWPVATLACFPLIFTSAGTVCVQIGQWTCALTFPVALFIVFRPHFIRTQDLEHGLCQSLKYFQSPTAGACTASARRRCTRARAPSISE
jgi:hypothetical protein